MEYTKRLFPQFLFLLYNIWLGCFIKLLHLVSCNNGNYFLKKTYRFFSTPPLKGPHIFLVGLLLGKYSFLKWYSEISELLSKTKEKVRIINVA